MDPHCHRDRICPSNDGLRKRPTGDARRARQGGDPGARAGRDRRWHADLPRPNTISTSRACCAGGRQRMLTAEQKNQVLDEMINMQLLAAQGLKDGLDKDPDIAAQHRRRAHARVGRCRIAEVSEGQGADRCRNCMPNMTLRRRHGQDRISRAAYSGRRQGSQGRAASRRSRAERQFRELAKTQSTDSSKANGGDLGWFAAARMAKPFGDAVKGLKKGEITSEPCRRNSAGTSSSSKIRVRPPPPPFEQVKQQVGNGVIQKKLEAYVDG